MKRREFLAGSAGLAGAMLPVLGRTETKPCPPPQLSVGNGAVITSECASGQAGPAPSWWTQLADGAWKAIADQPGQRISDEGVRDPNYLSPAFRPHGDASGIYTIMQDWTGGALDFDRNELVTVAHGGHNSYAGNEYYACPVKTETPRWYRVCDSTQPQDIRLDSPATAAYTYNDGRPRTNHGYGRQCYGNNRVWMTYQDAVEASNGGHARGVFTFNRAYRGLPTAPDQASYSASGLAPWEAWTPHATGNFHCGPAVYDPRGNRVLSFSGGHANPLYFTVFDAADPNSRAQYTHTSSLYCYYGWGVACPDLNIVVLRNMWGYDDWMGGTQHFELHGVAVMDLSQPLATPMQLVLPSNTGVLPAAAGAMGAAYHRASKSILIFDPQVCGNRIIQLKIPTTTGGSYNSSGSWTYKVLTPVNASILIDYQGRTGGTWRGTYGKFHVVQDMGDGRAGAFFFGMVDGPVYAYKIPQGV